MKNASTLWVGLDVHKDSITVAYASEDRHADPVQKLRLRSLGRTRLPNDEQPLSVTEDWILDRSDHTRERPPPGGGR